MSAGGSGERLAVTGIGLATSVGSSAQATVAALRAGIARFAEVPDVLLRNRSETRTAPAVAARSPLRHAAPETAGPSLLSTAITDASAWSPATTWEVHVGRWSGLSIDRATGLSTMTLHEEEGLVHTPVLARLAALAGQGAVRSSPHGLAAVDAPTCPAALGHYAEQGRLKGEAAPSGFVPGDVGAALVVESESQARVSGRAAFAVIEAFGQATETVHLGGVEPSSAQGLTDALAQAFPEGSPPPDLVVTDLNGERARALEWALAAPRALPPWHGHLPVWTPADGVGDGGVAVGGLLVACAALALAWGDAERALVVASDDAGMRVALVLHAADRLVPGCTA